MAREHPRSYGKPFFVRVRATERKIIEAAVKIQYGSVDQHRSEWARRVMLKAAKEIIERYKKEREGRG